MSQRVVESWLGIRNSRTRIPFRYGAATLTSCPQAVLEVVVETAGGRRARGWSGDCLPPGWFDKTPGRSYESQIRDQLRAAAIAREVYEGVGVMPSFFGLWRAGLDETTRRARAEGPNGLTASFGASLMERAVMDALARDAGLSLGRALRVGLLGIDAGAVHPELAGRTPADWLPARPARSIEVRHTVGLSDPLRATDLDREHGPGDGLPVTLEDHLDRNGLSCFKVKLTGDRESSLERLARFAELVESRRGTDYRLTLDGNEQFHDVDELAALLAAIRADPRLETLWARVMVLEQPLERAIALDPTTCRGLERVAAEIPMIIDESDDEIHSCRRALELGYRGVSSKNCKGPIKSVLNAGLIWRRNRETRAGRWLMTGEDLCGVGIVPVQADLCLAASLGLEHVERNGHHYHPGLSYLPREVREAGLAAHPDFLGRAGAIIGPSVKRGRFEIGTVVDAVGFGFSVTPERADWTEAEAWRYGSLGLPEEPGDASGGARGLGGSIPGGRAR